MMTTSRMFQMPSLDLAQLTHNKVRMLTGHQRGLAGRQHYALDKLEEEESTVTVVAPAELDTVTPSFVQGLFAGSLRNLGEAKFLRKYDLSKLSPLLQRDFEIGIERLRLHERKRSHQ